MSILRRPVPHHIRTERLVLRDYVLADAAQMDAVIPANREHLVPFMDWAVGEPVSPPERVELITKFNAKFQAGSDYSLGMFFVDSGEYVGGTGFHTIPTTRALEIGYWISASFEGLGLVSEAVAALTRVATGYLGCEFVEIKMVPENTRSREVARRLGFTQVDVRVAPSGSSGRPRRCEFWHLSASDFPQSPAAAYPAPTIFDRNERPIPWA